jgi:iron complex outermembrane receptor protein
VKDILSLLSCTILFGAYSIAQEDATAVVSLQAAEVLYQSQGEDLKERIASDSLANFLSVDLVSLLEETTSIWVNSYGKNGAASPVFRGTSAAHTQVYWNGVNINSATLGQSDLRTVRLGAGQVVSVNPGLQSLNDGSGGLGGSIHVNDILRRENYWSHSSGIGSFKKRCNSFSSNLVVKKWLFKTSVRLDKEENDFNFMNTSLSDNPIQKRLDEHLNSVVLSQSINRQIGLKNSLTFHGFYSKLDRGVADGIVSVQAEGELIDESIRGLLNWKRHSLWNHEAQLYASKEVMNYDQNVQSEFIVFSQAFNYQLDRKITNNLNLKLSSENQFYQVKSDGFSERKDVGRYSLKALLGGVIKRFNYDFLVRQEVFRNEPSNTMYSVSGAYRISEGLKMKISAGRTFRFPELNALFWNVGGNPDLLPENGVSLETEISYTSKKISTTISVYAMNNDNLIQWRPIEGTWTPENFQKAEIKGTELKINYQVWKRTNHGLSLKGSYSFNDSQVRMSDGWITNIYRPKHSARGGAYIQSKWLSISYIGQFLSGRNSTLTDQEDLPGFYISSLSLWRALDLTKRFKCEIHFKINNLTDKAYELRKWYPMPPRNYLITINFKHK